MIISGQFRNLNGIAGSLRRLQGVPHDVFISTWNKRGTKRAAWFGIYQYIRVFNKAIAYAIPSEYYGEINSLEALAPDFFSELDKRVAEMPEIGNDIALQFPNAIIDMEDEALFVSANHSFERITNTEKMLYKILRTVAMVRKTEDARGEKFTHVLRLRPDMAYAGDTPSAFDEAVFHFDWFTKAEDGTRCGDSVILAPRAGFEDLISAVYAKYVRALTEGQDLEIHHLLGSQLDEMGGTAGAVSVDLSSGEWPCEPFIQCLALRSEAVPIARTILANIHANEAVLKKQPLEALDFLKPVPPEHDSLPGVLWARMRSNELLANSEAAVHFARRLLSVADAAPWYFADSFLLYRQAANKCLARQEAV